MWRPPQASRFASRARIGRFNIIVITHYANIGTDFQRQIANFCLYKKVAKCNLMGMALPSSFPHTAPLARPWLERKKGECAFPVGGESLSLLACCRPSGTAAYCRSHAAAMRGPRTQSAADFERDILRFLDRAT
jgi:hypothetical protein